MNSPMRELSGGRRIAVLLVYFGLYLGLYQLFGMSFLYHALSLTAFRLSELIIQVSFLTAYILLSGRWLKDEAQRFADQKGRSIWIVLMTLILMELFVIFMGYILMDRLKLSTAENQTNNLMYEKINPIGFVLDSVLIAPFSEELVFRGCIYAPLRNKHGFWPGALIAGSLFGLMHALPSLLAGNISNLWYVLLYGGCGILLCFPYEAADTFFAPVFTHMLYNLLGTAAILLG